MYRVGATVSAVILAGGVAGVTMLGGASEPQVGNAERQTEQFEGRIVNLYFHMTEPEEYWDNDNDNDNGIWDDNDNDMQRDRDRRPQRDQMMRDAQNPLAIVVEEDRLIGTTTNTYVLIFEPDGMAPRQPGARPGQQPRQPGGQQPHDRDRDRHQDWDDDNDVDRPTNDMERENLTRQLRQHVGERVTIHGAKHEREDLTVILVQRIDADAQRRPGQQPGRQPGQQPRR